MTTNANPAASSMGDSMEGRERDRAVWTEDRIRRLGAVTDLPTAASIFDLGRALAYDLAKRGQFPVPVIRAGTRYRVPVAAILAALHLPGEPPT